MGWKRIREDAMVYIVGIGPGAKDYILPKAEDIIKSSEIIIGFERAVNSLEHIERNKFKVKSLIEILSYINSNEDRNIAIVASGDPCFYGITDYITRNYTGKVQVIPGISSFQYLFSKLNKSWQGAYLGSLHGVVPKGNIELIKVVKTHKLSIWLTDKVNSPEYICSELIKANIIAEVCVGENLSYEDERIVSGSTLDILKMKFNNLCIVILETM